MNEHNVAAFKLGLVAWPLNQSEAGVDCAWFSYVNDAVLLLTNRNLLK